MPFCYHMLSFLRFVVILKENGGHGRLFAPYLYHPNEQNTNVDFHIIHEII